MDDIFQGFVGRDDDLRGVEGYSNFLVMFYRSNLYTHSHRVAALVRKINPLAKKVLGDTYDPKKAEIIALVHDDAEIVFGDIQAGNKRKMTPAQLKEVKRAEQEAIKTIAKRFPLEVGGYNYKQLLKEYEEYSSLESQVVCYADKYDALGEALHEVYAGNNSFTTNIVNEYGLIPTPFEYYTEYFSSFSKKFPTISRVLDQPLDVFSKVDCRLEMYHAVAKQGRLHTKKNSKAASGDAHYDAWQKIVLGCGNDETIEALYTQKEGF